MKLEEVRRLLEAVTPGPWRCWDDGFTAGVVAGKRETPGYSGIDWTTMICGGDASEGYFEGVDAQFIALARTLVPKLIEAAAALRIIAAQASGDSLSHSRADCMAALAQAALATLEAEP